MCRVKKMQNSKETREKLSKLTKIYLLGFWVDYGIRECVFSGKYKRIKGQLVPLVWHYCDDNGKEDMWILMPITNTTTGVIVDWGFNKILMRAKANSLSNSYRRTRTNND